jgi:hypothetical protein
MLVLVREGRRTKVGKPWVTAHCHHLSFFLFLFLLFTISSCRLVIVVVSMSARLESLHLTKESDGLGAASGAERFGWVDVGRDVPSRVLLYTTALSGRKFITRHGPRMNARIARLCARYNTAY